MSLFALEDFWSDIVGSTTNSSLSLTIELELCRETEITDLYLHSIVEEQVAELQISVNHTVAMQIFDSGANLIEVALNLDFMQALSTSQQLIERLILAELK